jgi:RES domain-containing protein
VRVWKLTRERHRQAALAGIGARRFGGRWNSIGTAMGYASCSLELSVLESLVHIQLSRIPRDYIWIELEMPDDAVEPLRTWPAHWDSPGHYRTEIQAVGDAWIRSRTSLGLQVPAAVLPERHNVLVNPAHPRYPDIREVATSTFTWPQRLVDYLSSNTYLTGSE